MTKQRKSEACPDCDAEVGQQHEDDCDVARCTWCGQQFISCDMPALGERVGVAGCGMGRPDVWTGEWPGFADCRRFELWCVRNPNGPGWLPVPKSYPGASEDLNRLGPPEFFWDRDAQRWERAQPGVQAKGGGT